LSLGLPPAEDARALGQSLIDAQPHGGRALWPRGPRSTELGDRLRGAGWQVEQPLAYESAPRTALDTLPRAQAIFFASPSAVRVFAELYGGTASSTPGADSAIGVAIGRTTFDALLAETTLDLCDTISLPEPAPEALRVSLEHLDPGCGS
jgi:uroporphyrinogen-III synthase